MCEEGEGEWRLHGFSFLLFDLAAWKLVSFKASGNFSILVKRIKTQTINEIQNEEKFHKLCFSFEINDRGVHTDKLHLCGNY